MITFWIIVGIALVIWAFVIAVNGEWDGLDGLAFTAFFPGFLGGAVIAFVTFLVLMFSHAILRPITGYHWAYTKSDLVALTDERSSTGGSFFLGSGVIGTDASYVFYTAEPDGARIMRQVDAGTVRVYEDADRPYALYADHRVLDQPQWVPLPTLTGGTRHLVELHVPSHSIKTGINLGVQQK